MCGRPDDEDGQCTVHDGESVRFVMLGDNGEEYLTAETYDFALFRMDGKTP